MIKYYMNAPCKIIRNISDDFCEIIVYPKFNQDLQARSWCTECQVGNQGTPQKHICEEYQDIIDELENVENSIICIVENRLLADEPIEFKKIRFLDKEIEKRDNNLHNQSLAIADKENEFKKLENVISNSKEDIKYYENKILLLENELKTTTLNKKVSTPEDIDIHPAIYKNLIQRDYILRCLEDGGIENWEWYDESYPSEKCLSELI